MKRSVCIFLALFLLPVLAAFAGDGTFTNNAVKELIWPDGEIVTFTCTVDSIDTLTSHSFTLGQYDNISWATYPFGCIVSASSDSGTPKLTTYVEGSYDGTNWFVVDTLFSDLTSETAFDTTYNFNNKKFPYYRTKTYGVATNASDTVLDYRFWAYKRE